MKIANGPGSSKVLSLCDARRLKQARKSGERLQGLNYPKDHLVGYDEPTTFDTLELDPFFGLMGLGMGMPTGPREPKGDDSEPL